MRRQQDDQYISTSEPNRNPIGTPSSETCNVPSGALDPRIFTRVIPSSNIIGSSGYEPTKDPYQVSIVNPPSATSETPSEYTTGASIIIPIEPLSVNPNDAPKIIPNCLPSVNKRKCPKRDPRIHPSKFTRFQAISDPESLR